jgi:hypothetical protein
MRYVPKPNQIGPFTRNTLAISFLFATFLAAVAPAQENTWTTNGPEGGVIRAMAIDPANPATLYAGADNAGVFKSTNGGGSWRAVPSQGKSTVKNKKEESR